MKGRWCMLVLLGVAVTAAPVTAQVPYERILDAASEPEHWLTYSGSYGAQRYSTLDQISRANVDQLQPRGCTRLDRPRNSKCRRLSSMVSCISPSHRAMPRRSTCARGVHLELSAFAPRGH